jgi:hypothetical protein
MERVDFALKKIRTAIICHAVNTNFEICQAFYDAIPNLSRNIKKCCDPAVERVASPRTAFSGWQAEHPSLSLTPKIFGRMSPTPQPDSIIP